ncbi:MAG: hypothetical protein J5I52_00395 [Saprospiraceae bacterium]|nr:MAG: hypothetical protein UZ09_BCD002001075 [Bacteroidetes bacterium OLB9]MCO6462582.1 hypothetical protein [Saprospiraceae bacterium]
MRYVIFFLSTFLIIGCKNEATQPAQETVKDGTESPLYEQVMEIHDAVMPQMSKIHELKKQLTAIRTDQNAAEVDEKIKKLEEADEAMMSWMAMFKLPEQVNEQEAYLKNEKVNIELVAEKMKIAMSEASLYLAPLDTSSGQ